MTALGTDMPAPKPVTKPKPENATKKANASLDQGLAQLMVPIPLNQEQWKLVIGVIDLGVRHIAQQQSQGGLTAVAEGNAKSAKLLGVYEIIQRRLKEAEEKLPAPKVED